MIKLTNIINENIVTKIESIIKKVKSLPDTDDDSDLFQSNRNYKIEMLSFFEDLLKGIKSSELVRNRMIGKNLDGDPYKIFRDLNEPRSDVRNALILWSNKLDK